MMPSSQWTALSMANALLVADGLLDPEKARGACTAVDLGGREVSRLWHAAVCLLEAGAAAPAHRTPPLSTCSPLSHSKQVTYPDPPEGVDWGKLTVAELRAECAARRLASKGLKDELVQRLRQWDDELAREAKAHASQEAAAAEAAAAEGVSPTATNNAQLHAAQALYASMHRMEVRRCCWGAAAGLLLLGCCCGVQGLLALLQLCPQPSLTTTLPLHPL